MRVSIPHLLGGIGAFDVVHRDPKLTVVLSPVMDRDYVGMPQGCSDVGFTTFAVATATSSDVGGRRLGRVGVIGAVTFGCGVIRPRSLPIGARLRAAVILRVLSKSRAETSPPLVCRRGRAAVRRSSPRGLLPGRGSAGPRRRLSRSGASRRRPRR